MTCTDDFSGCWIRNEDSFAINTLSFMKKSKFITEVLKMDIVKKVAKMRLNFHASMLDVYNVANQLGILKDDKAEEIMKNHTMKCFDAMEHMGLDPFGKHSKD